MAASEVEKQVPEEDNLKLIKQEAENGSQEHQAKLGQHYLKLADSNINRDENLKLALNWLVKSSKQGNEEATNCLKKCVENETGIDETNGPDIKWCLNTSTLEKQIRHASARLFQNLNSTHKKAISRDEYFEAIKSLPGQRQQKLLMAAGRKIGQEITENDFVKTLSKKIQGTLTLTSDEEEGTTEAYKSATTLQKFVKFPRQTAGVMMDHVLEYSSKEGMNWVVSLIPTNQIYLLALLFVYSYITPKFLFFFIPLFIFYLSFASLTISSMQMFYKRKKQSDAANLAGLLKEYDMSIDIEKTESQYSWNSLTPYLVFFSNLPVAIASFSLANKDYIPVSELCVIALFFAVFCFIGLGDSHDKITFLTLGANLLASLPVFLQNFPEIPVIKWFVMLISQPFYQIDFGFGFFGNISLPSVAFLLIPIFFIRMAMAKSWQGTYRILVPHLVCYFWWNITTSFFPYTSFTGLLRATIGYILMPILLPMGLLIFLVMTVFAIYKLCQTALFGKILVTAALLMIPIALTQTKAMFGKSADKKYATIKKVLMVSFSLLAIVPLLFVRMPSLKTEASPVLTWDDFKALCIPESEDNIAGLQLRCDHFVGTRISWTGEVVSTKISKIENTADGFMNTLPNFLADPLRCIYGVEFPPCDQNTSGSDEFKFCNLMKSLGHTCHVKNHATYNFQIVVKTDGVSLNIDVGPEFKETVFALSPNIHIAFNATLTGNLGTGAPSLKLGSLKSLDKELILMMAVEQEDGFYIRSLYESFSFTFNFIWFPVMELVI
ncbi:wolframin [Patella vulgata]|uniref:wolframin n=1 Tax=Patella vulgata TaxID=6465 RepID=UPI00217FB75A|nr:wolframin [Patella vulgata]